MLTLSTLGSWSNVAAMKRDTYHHGALRQTLLQEARALLDEGGPEAVTLREAARRSGVSATATYRHFRDKDALLAALAVEGFEEFGERLAASVADGRPFSEMGRAYVAFALDRPGLFRLMFSSLLARRSEHPEFEAASARAFLALQAASRGHELTPARDEAAAISAWSLAHGLAHLLLDRVIPSEVREATLDAVFGPRAP